MTGIALTLAVLGSLVSIPPQATHVSSLANQVLQSTTIEWQDAFAASRLVYKPPRLLIVDLPRRHRARGSGYGNGVVMIDRRELNDVLEVFKGEGLSLGALIMAHEVGHHVQFQLRPGGPSLAKEVKELQADCLAGWWLSRSNARALRQSGNIRFELPDIEFTLPRLLGALNMLGGHIGVRGLPASSVEHGTVQERVKAITRGLQSSSPAGCGLAMGR